jgi:hypothetical protein
MVWRPIKPLKFVNAKQRKQQFSEQNVAYGLVNSPSYHSSSLDIFQVIASMKDVHSKRVFSFFDIYQIILKWNSWLFAFSRFEDKYAKSKWSFVQAKPRCNVTDIDNCNHSTSTNISWWKRELRKAVLAKKITLQKHQKTYKFFLLWNDKLLTFK